MTRRQWSLIGILVLIVILALALRDVVAAAIIIPAAFLWWLIRLYYASIPQAIFWGLLILLTVYSAVTTVIPALRFRSIEKTSVKITRGHIEILADWIKKSGRGTYYKWLVANRLGKDAREILAQREGNPISKKFNAFPKRHRDNLTGRGWNPPQKIDTYLNIGLNGSFTNILRPRWFWQSPPPTPLDVEIQQVIDYLEDEMEMEHGRDSKSI